MNVVDSSLPRNQMVDTQIRPAQVSDPRVIKAMREVPRERFVPVASLALAYADRPVPLSERPASPSPGMLPRMLPRMLMEPRIIARLLQVAIPRSGETALVVAAGTGYAAALLARLGLVVVALEQDSDLAERGAALCAELAPSVRFVRGALREGWPSSGPYDLILIDGAVRALPEAMASQLAVGGRLAAVIREEGQVGTAVLAEASNGVLRGWPQFDAQAALIPELSPGPAFDF